VEDDQTPPASPASGVAWTQLGVGVLPTLWANSIIVDPANPNHVIVAFSGYREGNNSANVWESYDGARDVDEHQR